MIIDSHMHIGKVVKKQMSEKMLIDSLKKHNVDIGIFSAIDIDEREENGKIIPYEKLKAQRSLNERALKFSKKYKNLKAQFWIKPFYENYEEWIEEFLTENRDYFCSMKIHPVTAHIKITDEKVKAYINLAKKLKMPIACHTAGDEYSKTEHLFDIAKENTEIDFVAVHMGLGTDNEKSIELISKMPNLYGDTTWVSVEKVIKAINICGSEKILFGTDAPIDGIDTITKYKEMLDTLKEELSKEEFENVTYKNAIRVFKLKL